MTAVSSLHMRPGQSTELVTLEIKDTLRGWSAYAALRPVIEPMLDGADMEHVTVMFEGRRCDMFVDEVGKLSGLARNEHATTLYRAWSLSQEPGRDPETLPAIHGPAVLCCETAAANGEAVSAGLRSLARVWW